MMFVVFSIGVVNRDTYYGSVHVTPRESSHAVPTPLPPEVSDVPVQDPAQFDLLWEEIGSSPMKPGPIGAPGYRNALTQFSSGGYANVQHQPNNNQIMYRRNFPNNWLSRYYPYPTSSYPSSSAQGATSNLQAGFALPSIGETGDYPLGAHYFYQGVRASSAPPRKIAQIKVFSTSTASWPVAYR